MHFCSFRPLTNPLNKDCTNFVTTNLQQKNKLPHNTSIKMSRCATPSQKNIVTQFAKPDIGKEKKLRFYIREQVTLRSQPAKLRKLFLRLARDHRGRFDYTTFRTALLKIGCSKSINPFIISNPQQIHHVYSPLNTIFIPFSLILFIHLSLRTRRH